MSAVLALPRPERTFRPFHPRALAALAHGAVAHGADHGRMQIVVPKALTDGRDLDLVRSHMGSIA